MALLHEDFVEIKRVLDDRYVLQSDCSETQERINKRFANDDKRIDRLLDMMRTWNKLLWAIASASISALVVALLQLILK